MKPKNYENGKWQLFIEDNGVSIYGYFAKMVAQLNGINLRRRNGDWHYSMTREEAQSFFDKNLNTMIAKGWVFDVLKPIY
jgi:hypothetical protein